MKMEHFCSISCLQKPSVLSLTWLVLPPDRYSTTKTITQMSLIIWLQRVELILYLWYLKNTNYISYIKNNNAHKNISFTYYSSFFIFKSMSHPLHLLGCPKQRVQDSIFLSCFYSKLDSQKFFMYYWDLCGSFANELSNSRKHLEEYFPWA